MLSFNKAYKLLFVPVFCQLFLKKSFFYFSLFFHSSKGTGKSTKEKFKILCLKTLRVFRRSGNGFFIFFFFSYSSSTMAVIGSITDPEFSSEQKLEESFFGDLKGSVNMKLSRNLRRGNWDDFFSNSHKNSLFDSLLIRSDLNLNYPLSKTFSVLNESSNLKEMLLFFTLSYKRPAYDIPEVIKNYCYKLYFCFGEISLGVSDTLLEKSQFKTQYSLYFTIPITSKSSYDQMKYFGLGVFLKNSYPILFAKQNFQVKGISSHFFDTALYGSFYANESGSRKNEVFSAFNQFGLVFSGVKKIFIPRVFLYFSHRVSMDYDLYFVQLISFSSSASWSISQRLQVLLGLSWGGDIFQHEFSNQATDIDFFNADETSLNGGLSYSF